MPFLYSIQFRNQHHVVVVYNSFYLDSTCQQFIVEFCIHLHRRHSPVVFLPCKYILSTWPKRWIKAQSGPVMKWGLSPEPGRISRWWVAIWVREADGVRQRLRNTESVRKWGKQSVPGGERRGRGSEALLLPGSRWRSGWSDKGQTVEAGPQEHQHVLVNGPVHRFQSRGPLSHRPGLQLPRPTPISFK